MNACGGNSHNGPTIMLDLARHELMRMDGAVTQLPGQQSRIHVGLRGESSGNPTGYIGLRT